MAVRFYLAPVVVQTMRAGRLVWGVPLLEGRRPDERVTILKMNQGNPRWCLCRYEATASRISLADTHPLVIPLPTDKDGRMSVWARMQLARMGLPVQQTSTRNVARFIFDRQARAQTDTPIVMGFEDV